VYIALNPDKAKRFTTKGIHLTPSKPVAYVQPGLEPEFAAAIAAGLADGSLIQIDDEKGQRWTVTGQGSVGRIREGRSRRIGEITPIYKTVDGKRVVVGRVLSFDGEPDEAASEAAEPCGLSPIVDEHEERHVKFSKTFPESPETEQ
jgi:hypothetical protein